MSKVLKTGDVKRVPNRGYRGRPAWAVVSDCGLIKAVSTCRRMVRWFKGEDRIARILSIGPKLVTVRIEK